MAGAVVAASRAQGADFFGRRQSAAGACLEGEIIDAWHPPGEFHLPAATDLTCTALPTSYRGGLEAQLTEVAALQPHLNCFESIQDHIYSIWQSYLLREFNGLK